MKRFAPPDAQLTCRPILINGQCFRRWTAQVRAHLLRRGLWLNASCQLNTLLSHRPSNKGGLNLFHVW